MTSLQSIANQSVRALMNQNGDFEAIVAESGVVSAHCAGRSQIASEDLLEKSVVTAGRAIQGHTRCLAKDGEVDLAEPWAHVRLDELVMLSTGLDLSLENNAPGDVIEVASQLLPDRPLFATAGDALVSIFEHYVEANLVWPIFVIDFPLSCSPLASSHPLRPLYAHRSQAYMNGQVIGQSAVAVDGTQTSFNLGLSRVVSMFTPLDWRAIAS